MAGHIVSKSIYYAIFGALMVLTAVTIFVAYLDLGHDLINDIAALTIATTKATLVILYFMHLRYSSRLTWVVVVAGFFWLGILFVLGMSDYLSRDWLDVPGR
jgi:cytochrome c oxidase subunit IV